MAKLVASAPTLSISDLDFDQFCQKIGACTAIPDLNGLFGQFVRLFGFTAYAVGFTPDAGGNADEPFLFIHWPRTWLELYAREGFASEDAVVAAAATAQEPFTWRELQQRQPGASARIFEAARGFGWSDGLLVPVIVKKSLRRRIGVVSLAATHLENFDAQSRQAVIESSKLAFHRALELSEAARPTPLSDREQRAITLVAAGRSDREIADILKISIATAHFHVEQAKKKLGAVTRAQAVALAVGHGFVSP